MAVNGIRRIYMHIVHQTAQCYSYTIEPAVKLRPVEYDLYERLVWMVGLSDLFEVVNVCTF